MFVGTYENPYLLAFANSLRDPEQVYDPVKTRRRARAGKDNTAIGTRPGSSRYDLACLLPQFENAPPPWRAQPP